MKAIYWPTVLNNKEGGVTELPHLLELLDHIIYLSKDKARLLHFEDGRSRRKIKTSETSGFPKHPKAFANSFKNKHAKKVWLCLEKELLRGANNKSQRKMAREIAYLWTHWIAGDYESKNSMLSKLESSTYSNIKSTYKMLRVKLLQLAKAVDLNNSLKPAASTRMSTGGFHEGAMVPGSSVRRVAK